MRKSKQIIASVMALVLVAAIAVGGTLAYLSASASVDNPFTFTKGDGVIVDIDEGDWDPDSATNLFPGVTVTKEPEVFNNSAGDVDIDVWAAIKVSYVKDDAVLASDDAYYTDNIEPYVTLNNLDTTNFTAEAVNGEAATIYYFNAKLLQDGSTGKLFDSVTISSTMPNDIANALNAGGGFKIRVEAAAIQATGFDTAADAKTELTGLFS